MSEKLLTKEEIEQVWPTLGLDARVNPSVGKVFRQAALLAAMQEAAPGAAFNRLLAEARKRLEKQT